MTGDELRTAAIEIFGTKGWRDKTCQYLGISRTQLWRYLKKKEPFVGPVRAAMVSALRLHRLGEKV